MAVGAATALLLAPETGEELRSQLQDDAARSTEALQNALQRDVAEVNDRIAKMQVTLQQYAEKASSSSSDISESAADAVEAAQDAVDAAQDAVDEASA